MDVEIKKDIRVGRGLNYILYLKKLYLDSYSYESEINNLIYTNIVK